MVPEPLPRHNIDADTQAEWMRHETAGDVLLRIGPHGDVHGFRFTPQEATELARWILDTVATATMPVPQS